MRVCQNKSIKGLKRRCERPDIADARKPGFLIELCVGHLAHSRCFVTPILALFSAAPRKPRYDGLARAEFENGSSWPVSDPRATSAFALPAQPVASVEVDPGLRVVTCQDLPY